MKNGGAWGCVFVMSGVAAITALLSLDEPKAEPARPNFRGRTVEQLYEKVEVLRPLYSQWEADWNVGPGLHFAKDHWEVPAAALALYLLMVFVGPSVMAKREAHDLVLPLAAWNWFLAVFSLAGTIRTLPHLANDLTGSFRDTICDSPDSNWGVGSTGLWVQLFIFSKLPELLDTVFIVLRKKKLLFLHWYHHVTVLLYCWHAYATECGAGLYFVAMNYTVHAVMYAYFAFQTLRLVPKWFPAFIITGMQIAQMFVGMFICGSSVWHTVIRPSATAPCHNDITNLVLGTLMYLSYLFLFLKFAFSKYFPARKPTKMD